MAIQEYIKSLKLENNSYRGDCPLCMGKNTFTVTRSGNYLMYNCYRNSCNTNSIGSIKVGFTKDSLTSYLSSLIPSRSRLEAQEIEYQLSKLPPYLNTSLLTPALLEAQQKGIVELWLDSKRYRLVLKDLRGCMVGRSIVFDKPKWLNYRVNKQPFMVEVPQEGE